MAPTAVALMFGVLWAAAQAKPTDTWMPPAMEEIVVKQLVDRLQEIELGWSRDRMNDAARVTVATIRSRLDGWMEPELLRRAPALEHLELPTSGDHRLDAMLCYHVCTALSMIRHERRASVTNENDRIAAVAGMTTGSLAVLFLRHGYIANGGSGAEVETFLTAPALQKTLDRIQIDPDDRALTEGQCVPVLGAITG